MDSISQACLPCAAVARQPMGGTAEAGRKKAEVFLPSSLLAASLIPIVSL